MNRSGSTVARYISEKKTGKYKEEDFVRIQEMEEEVDRYEDALGSYLIKLNNKNLSPRDSRSVSVILHCINDFERICDHAVNIIESAKEMHDKKLSFSANAMKEFEVYTKAVHKIVHMAVNAYVDNDLDNARIVEPLEEVINGLNAEMKQRHIRRLRKGKCTVEMGFVLADITNNYERIADHCSNLAINIMQLFEDDTLAHEYVDTLQKGAGTDFDLKYQFYLSKYELPGK